jgi:coenzyme PQQ biosynthesis protein PqqD
MRLSPASVPSLWRLARVEFDSVRQRPVLLYPEGAVLLNETGADILRLVDGRRTVGEIAGILGERYNGEGGPDAAEILRDVTAYLSGLEARELIRDH